MNELERLAGELDIIRADERIGDILSTVGHIDLEHAAAILLAASKVDVAGLMELAAEVVYNSWSDQPGFVPWVAGGNSHKQDEARAISSKLETALRMALATREWVGLTDEEIKTEWGLFMSGQGSGHIPDFVHAIEAKIKEKNHG